MNDNLFVEMLAGTEDYAGRLLDKFEENDFVYAFHDGENVYVDASVLFLIVEQLRMQAAEAAQYELDNNMDGLYSGGIMLSAMILNAVIERIVFRKHDGPLI